MLSTSIDMATGSLVRVDIGSSTNLINSSNNNAVEPGRCVNFVFSTNNASVLSSSTTWATLDCALRPVLTTGPATTNYLIIRVGSMAFLDYQATAVPADTTALGTAFPAARFPIGTMATTADGEVHVRTGAAASEVWTVVGAQS
jgi:hypothetical protein